MFNDDHDLKLEFLENEFYERYSQEDRGNLQEFCSKILISHYGICRDGRFTGGYYIDEDGDKRKLKAVNWRPREK